MGSKIQVKAGNVLIGGGAPVSVQSMLNVPSTDIEGSAAQAKRLEEAGCQIIRAAIPDMEAVKLIPALKEAVRQHRLRRQGKGCCGRLQKPQYPHQDRRELGLA